MMKTIQLLSVSLCVLVTCLTAAEPAQQIVLGLSPYMPAKERTSQLTMIQRFLLKDAPAGSRVTVWDGWSLTVVCDSTVPVLSYESSAARAQRMASALSGLSRWFEQLEKTESPPSLKDSGVMKIPEWLYAATGEAASGRRVLVIFASPFCIVPSEPSFSMTQSRYPADGHLRRTLAESVYGTAEKRERLNNCAVHWAYSSEDIWTSGSHHDSVMRWWALFVAAQGGQLSTFSSDGPQVLLTALKSNQRAVGEFAVNPDDGALVMHVAKPREVPEKVEAAVVPEPAVALPETNPDRAIVELPATTPVSSPESPAPSNVTVIARAPTPVSMPAETKVETVTVPRDIPTPPTGIIGIAAVWDGARGTDIDLYCAAKTGWPEAYWRNPRAPHVRYFRDVRTPKAVSTTANWSAIYEYCEIEHGRLDEPTVWLNVYRASAPVRGIIRVQCEGRIVDRAFEFNVTRGNGGADSDLTLRSKNRYWQKFEIKELLSQSATKGR